MQKSKMRIPTGLIIVLVLGLIGFKDTGIFVSSFNARLNNGVEVNYSPNNRAEIIGEGASKTTYHVESADGTRFYVPKEYLLKVDNGVNGYTVLNNTPLYDNSGEVIRLLFLDEYLTFVENRGDQALVRASDGLTGYVNKSDLDPDRIRNIVEGIAIDNINANNGTNTLNINKGDSVKVAWFERDYFIIFDEFENKYQVSKNSISLFEKPEEVKKSVEDVPVKKIVPMSGDSRVNASATALSIANKAETLIGSPYVYGDVGKAGYDCSGMVYALYGEFTDIKMPRSSRQMAEVGELVEGEDLQTGDLLFFTSSGSSTISHVGLYVGDGMMIHASNNQGKIIKDPISGYYFQNNFSHARRWLD
ncbi:MAG: C40 family peptidase [Tissierellia bacterium]|nr:C40 family peptidase [Tissierellia bacterium]